MRGSLPIVVLLLVSFSCRETPPGPGGDTPLSLKAVDASCTEVWLEVKLAAGIQPRTLTLQRNSQTVLATTLASAETLIVDEGLLPNRAYTYAVTRPNGLHTDKATAAITTLDTTSHDFTWQVDTLGDGSSGVLYDVAIINDTLAYAVGEMYVLGDPRRYNLAVWNGTSWRIERLSYQGSPPVLHSVFAFGKNDVWFDPWFHWNGQIFQEVAIDPIFLGVGVNKLWGSPGGELFAVGNGGFIARRNTSGTWQRVESGTTLPIQDIWGDGEEILAIASNVLSFPRDKKLLRIQVTSVTIASDSGLPLDMSGIWFMTDRQYYLVGDGVYRSRHLGNLWSHDTTHPLIYKYAIHGDGLNDVVIAGGFGLLSHFNGLSWKHYQGVELPSFFGSYFSISMKRNLFIAVGWVDDRAIVLRGVRR